MWKDCVKCDKYEISTYGEIRRKATGKILQQKLDKSNTLSVHLSLGKRDKSDYYSVHRLVAETFLPNPDNLPWVVHKDGNLLNNQVSNLKWTSSKWNNTMIAGANAPNSKLSDEQVTYCRNVYKPRDKNYGLTSLAKKFNVACSTMSYILNYKTYR